MSDPSQPLEGLDPVAASLARFALDAGKDVLQLGAGPHSPALCLTTRHGRDVTLVTEQPDVPAEAGLDVVAADVGATDWAAALSGRDFDVVVLVGVLEQVRDPRGLLSSILSAGLLRTDGLLVASASNAARGEAVAQLLRGDVADGGGARFGLAGLRRLLESAGFVADRVDRIGEADADGAEASPGLGLAPEVYQAVRALNPEIDVRHYVVRAVVDGSAGRLARQQEDFESERRTWDSERAALVSEAAALRSDLQRANALLREERAVFAAELEAGAAELTERDEKIGRLQARRDKLVRERNRARRVAEASMYEESRGVRVAARVVRRLRAWRGSRG